MLKHRNALRKSLCPVVIYPYLCSSEHRLPRLTMTPFTVTPFVLSRSMVAWSNLPYYVLFVPCKRASLFATQSGFQCAQTCHILPASEIEREQRVEPASSRGRDARAASKQDPIRAGLLGLSVSPSRRNADKKTCALSV